MRVRCADHSRTTVPSSAPETSPTAPTARRHFLALLGAAFVWTSCGGTTGGATAPGNVVRIGHFPNVTHAHGLVAHALSRQGKGIFEKHLGAGFQVEWHVFQAGPSAMESVLTGALDACYVGPSPALNAYQRTQGAEVRVLAGATEGGSALVVRTAAGIERPEQLRGRRIATPQLGNTQDVACRHWLLDHGIRVTLTGGDAFVVPTGAADQLAFFQTGDLDAAWAVEPWVSRLEVQGGGRLLFEEKDATTTVLVGRAAFVAERPDLTAALHAAHVELTAWIRANPAEAKALVRSELETLTRRPLPSELLDRCWPRLYFTDTVRIETFQTFVDHARATGLTRTTTDLGQLLHTTAHGDRR